MFLFVYKLLRDVRVLPQNGNTIETCGVPGSHHFFNEIGRRDADQLHKFRICHTSVGPSVWHQSAQHPTCCEQGATIGLDY